MLFQTQTLIVVTFTSLLLFHAHRCRGNQSESAKVNVSVVYATLCQPSTRLIHNQLIPVWMEFKDYVSLTFLPYGKTVSNKNAEGKWDIQCQNGPSECLGNKIQACALNEFKDDADRSIRYVGCFMTYNNFYPYNTTCFEDLVDNDPEQTIKFRHCVNSEKGDDIVAHYGNITMSIEPSITVLPTLIFNGIHKLDVQHKARTNFRSVICDHLKHLQLAACSKSKSRW